MSVLYLEKKTIVFGCLAVLSVFIVGILIGYFGRGSDLASESGSGEAIKELYYYVLMT